MVNCLSILLDVFFSILIQFITRHEIGKILGIISQ